MGPYSTTRAWTPLEDPAISAAALDLTGDALIIVTREPASAVANAAASALLGLRIEDVSPDTISAALSGWTDELDHLSLLARVSGGVRWSGTVVEDGKAGWHREREALLMPLDDSLQAGGVVLLRLRDPSIQVEGSDGSDHEADHAIVVSVMQDVRAESTVEATSLAICEAVARIDGIDGAMLLILPPKGDLVHVTNVGPPLPGFEFGARIPIDNIEPLMQMTKSGPWSLDFTNPGTGELIGVELAGSIAEAGITATAYAGIHQNHDLVGVLAVASMDSEGPASLQRRLGVLAQVGAFAGMVLANQAVLFGRAATLRDDVQAILDSHGFWSFVQPIVSLTSGLTVGYEALTRFEDGRRPDHWIAEAHSVGLGVELEEACASSALLSLGDAHPEAWLAINFSPEAVIGGVVGRLANRHHRQLVVEITEHSAIEEYEEIRRVMADLPGVEISIDDAGSGFASLRHILELNPNFVKLDIGIVRDVDVDPARAAMVAGMVHFAAVTGTHLIAEGVETAGEAETLAQLGVALAQGHFFHRPAPVADFAD